MSSDNGLGGLHRRYDPNETFPEAKQVTAELYNLENDISEQNNLYNSNLEEAKQMKEELLKVVENNE